MTIEDEIRAGKYPRLWLPPEGFLDAEDVPTPKSDRLVIQVVVGDHAEEEHSLTGDLVRSYADWCGADYVVLRGDRTGGRWPMANKWRISTVAKQYARTLYLDADVLVKNDAPNIFDAHDGAAFYNEYEETQNNAPERRDWIGDEMKELTGGQGCSVVPEQCSFNGGVMLHNRTSIAYYRPPESILKVTHCADQQWLTCSLLASKVPYSSLHWQWHNGFVSSRFWERLPRSHFIHLNGSRPHDYRMELMRRLLSGDFRKLLPPATTSWAPAWA